MTKKFKTAGALGALLLRLAAPAVGDQQAAMTNANSLVSAADTVQTCEFAPWRSHYNMRESQAAWAIGPHPSCAVAAAWILGNAAALYVLPHNKFFKIAVGFQLGTHAATVGNNARLMATWRLK